MKKAIILSLSLAFCASAVLAANQQGSGLQSSGEVEMDASGQSQQGQLGEQVQSQQQTQNQGEEQQLQVQEQTQESAGIMMENQQKAGTVNEARTMIQQRSQELSEETQELKGVQQKVYQNQNALREAVHGLLAIEDLAGGIGSQVSQIAREFNNSVQNTIAAEEKIQGKSALARFFMGGEKEAAEELKQELQQNEQRLQELKQLKDQCNCTEDVKALIQEQIENMDQEQLRLQVLAEKEEKSNGIFGWVRNLFR